MTNLTYELRSAKGRPMLAFDSRHRAVEAKQVHERRARTTLKLFEIERTEREVTC